MSSRRPASRAAVTVMCEDEEFIRYHFGEMTVAESEAFSRRLEGDPGLAARFATFQQCLADCEAESTPHGLADRTATSIKSMTWSCPLGLTDGGSRVQLVDWIAGSVAVLVVAVALIPAALHSRETARREACAKNLTVIGQALFHYAEDHNGYFPNLGPRSHAGVFAVRLADEGYLSREMLRRSLVCPSSPLAELIANRKTDVVVPTPEQLQLAPRVLAEPLIRTMGGSYAYRLGYLRDRIYFPVNYNGGCRSALMSDAPSGSSASSHNHGGCAQNVLCQSGQVRFWSGCFATTEKDHLFLNASGVVAAGQSPSDTVLAPSWATPGPADGFFQVGPNR